MNFLTSNWSDFTDRCLPWVNSQGKNPNTVQRGRLALVDVRCLAKVCPFQREDSANVVSVAAVALPLGEARQDP